MSTTITGSDGKTYQVSPTVMVPVATPKNPRALSMDLKDIEIMVLDLKSRIETLEGEAEKDIESDVQTGSNYTSGSATA